MAGIFNLFGGLSEPDKGQLVKPLSRSKKTIGGSSLKAVGHLKPKGLSIRPKSDVNVPVTPRLTGAKQDASNNKQQEFLKPKLTQLDTAGRPASPVKELAAKKSNMRPLKMRDLSPKKELLGGKIMKSRKLSDELVFKKPLPPKKITKRPAFAEPENLAPYYNFDRDFDDIYSRAIENEFKDLLKEKELVKPFEDEGFESDPEELSWTKIPTLSLSREVSDEECKTVSSPGLPDISDDDDNF